MELSKEQIEKASLDELNRRANELHVQFMSGAAWPASADEEFEAVQREILRRTADCGSV